MAFLGLALLVAGCAEMPKDFAFVNVAKTPKVWPNPPEKARYRYVGELTGEMNFIERPEEETGSVALKVLNWLVGLTSDLRKLDMLLGPQSGMVDAEGRIYVTDVNRKAVFVFDRPEGKLQVWEMALKNTPFQAPIGIAQGKRIVPAGQVEPAKQIEPAKQQAPGIPRAPAKPEIPSEILVTDAELHSVFRLNQQGESLGEFGKEVLLRPTGLARDAERGLIYVADTHAHDIKVFGDDGLLQKVIGHRGEGDGEFNFPTFLAFADDRLYVTDTMNARIQIFGTDGKMIAKFGQRGLQVGELVRPKGVAADSERNVYVIESQYDHMLVFDRSGRTLLALGGTGKGAGQFYQPSGIWVDSQDYIYVADLINGRVVVLQFLGGS